MPLISKLVSYGLLFGALLLTPTSAQFFNPQQPSEIVWVDQPTPEWAPRYDTNCAEFNTPLLPHIRKTVILNGGLSDANVFDDTWISTDHGSTWKRQIPKPGKGVPWPGKSAGNLALLANKNLIQFAGQNKVNGNMAPTNTVYYSRDQGISWNQVAQANIPWIPRVHASSVTIPNSNIVVFMNGQIHTHSEGTNEVWLSFDGKGELWTQRASGPWSPRFRSAATVTGDIALGSTIVVTGGLDVATMDEFNDVYFSKDLAGSWTLATAAASFLPRSAANLIAYGPSIYLFNGVTQVRPGQTPPPNALYSAITDSHIFYDTWVTHDNGVTWSENPPNQNLYPRYAACASMTMPGQVVTYTGTQDDSAGIQNVQIANFYNGTATSALPQWSGLDGAIGQALAYIKRLKLQQRDF